MAIDPAMSASPAEPVEIAALPDAPPGASPDPMDTAPDAPLLPAAAEFTVTAPPTPDVLDPDESVTSPPFATELSPADTATSPPAAAPDAPALKEIPPLSPPEADPVEIVIMPLLPALAAPVVTPTAPPAPDPDTSLVPTCTDPLML